MSTCHCTGIDCPCRVKEQGFFIEVPIGYTADRIQLDRLRCEMINVRDWLAELQKEVDCRNQENANSIATQLLDLRITIDVIGQNLQNLSSRLLNNDK